MIWFRQISVAFSENLTFNYIFRRLFAPPGATTYSATLTILLSSPGFSCLFQQIAKCKWFHSKLSLQSLCILRKPQKNVFEKIFQFYLTLFIKLKNPERSFQTFLGLSQNIWTLIKIVHNYLLQEKIACHMYSQEVSYKV